MKKKTEKKIDKLDFETAFKYPFKRAVGLFNILWFLLPIIGWFALYGYGIRIVKHFSNGDFKGLPKFKFGKSLGLGFIMFIKSIPFMIVLGILNSVLGRTPMGFLGILFLLIFVVPILAVNFFNKETVASYFEVKKLAPVFNNLGEYIMVILKSILLKIIFFVMIIILVGLPAGAFTKNIFIADFYRRYVK
ncbi:DUF4013 domain-containing protein [Candidatus Woesearchaeota archaeon]|nr:DUF4013 domain-containing protein [Candidatus Woesearchaeota archaeon]